MRIRLDSSQGGGARPLSPECEMLEARTMLTVPIPSNFNFYFEAGHSLMVDISVPVNPGQPLVTDGMTNSDLTLEKATTDANIPASSIVLSNPSGQQGTFTFTNLPGPILSDGNYRASISKQTVAHNGDQMSADAIRDFFVFAADANRDRWVNSNDFNILASNFGLSGKAFSEGNFNYDPAGLVNSDDFNILAERFGTQVPALPAGPNEITVGARPDFKFDTAWVGAGVTGEVGWRVQYSFSGQFDENPIPYMNLPADSTSWTTDAFGDGTRVWFRSRAYGNGQDTAYSPKRYAITHLPPPTITSVTAQSATQIKVDFIDNSQNATHFQMYRSTNPTSGFVAVGSPILSGEPTTFTDSGLAPSTQYYFHVIARNAVIDSSPSNTGNAATSGIVIGDLVEDFIPQQMAEITVTGAYTVPAVSQGAALIGVFISPPEDLDQPFLRPADYDAQAQPNGSVVLTFTRPAPYVVKAVYQGAAEQTSGFATLFFESAIGSTGGAKIGKSKKAPVPTADLILISSAGDGFNFAARQSILGEEQISNVDDVITAIQNEYIERFFQPFSVAIIDHGNVGLQSMGGGKAPDPGEYIAYNDPVSANDLALFMDGAENKITTLTFYGCEVAQGAAGEAFLQQVANGTGAITRGFDRTTYFSWLPIFGGKFWVDKGGMLVTKFPS